jgi:DNA-binding helix-hairpin-helix protein with protein kinase domain
MRLQRQSNQQIITLDVTSTLGHGGEARIFAVPQDETLVAKVYHKPTVAHAQKLVAMLANPPENPTAGQGHISIAWPVDLLGKMAGSDALSGLAQSAHMVGFLMPRVKGMHSILDFYNPKTRRQKCPFFNYTYLHRTARNLAAAFGALHARGYCIGDVNESNILVGDTALVTLVDTDSFQVREPNKGVVYRCPVGKPEFTPPELQGKSFQSVDRAIEHDLFGLAVLIFQLLMEGTHPFSGIFQGVGDPPPYETRIAAGHFSYSIGRRVPYIATPIAPTFEILHPSLRQLFVRCFEDGHNNPQMRPSAQTWQSALNEAEKALVTCSANQQHRYGQHLNACPWCERSVKLGGRDPFPSLQAVKRGQHLQPLKPRQRSPHRSNRPVVAPMTRTMTRQRARFVTVPVKKKKQRFSPFMLGLFGAGVLGFLELMVIVKDLKLAPETSATLSRTTNDPALVDQTTNSAKGFLTYYNQGNTYSKLGDYEGAIDNFNQALRLNPKNAKAYVNRGNARYEIAQHSGDPDKQYRGAIEDFNKALRLNPDQTEAYVSRGHVRYIIAQYSKDPNKDYKAAISDFNQALRRDPNNAKAYVKRGIVRYKLAQYSGDPNKDYKAAISDFNQALRLNPQEAEAYVKRGIVRYELGQYSGTSNKNSWGAVEDLQKAAKIFLEQGNIEHYQQALGNICVVLEKDCDSFLRNPEKFILSEPQPTKGDAR